MSPMIMVVAGSVSFFCTVTSDARAQRGQGGAEVIHPVLLQRLNSGEVSVKAWVLFTDKGFVDPISRAEAIKQTAASYNVRARQRRAKRRVLPGSFDENDLPVSQVYLDAVRATGATIRHASRWVNGLSVWASRSQLIDIAALPFVRVVQPVRHGPKYVSVDIAPATEFSDADPRSRATAQGSPYGLAQDQLTQINLIALHDRGFTGQGVIVGVLDTGFKRTHDVFNHPDHPLQVVAEWDFVDGDADTSPQPGDPSTQHQHGTMVLSTMAAYKPGNLLGAAYDASFILCKTEDITAEYMGEEDNFVAGLEFIEANGGDVATSSLGYIDWYTQADLDGLTGVTTVAVNIASGNGLHICTAAGNSGHDNNPGTSHLIAPADALNVITCGAVDSSGTIASFSSDGPSADGRIKPEVLARGVATAAASSSVDAGIVGVSGTSFSTPLVAGAVACITQLDPDRSIDQMRATLFDTASDFVQNGTNDATFVRGFGILDANAAGGPEPVPAVSGSAVYLMTALTLLAGGVVLNRRSQGPSRSLRNRQL